MSKEEKLKALRAVAEALVNMPTEEFKRRLDSVLASRKAEGIEESQYAQLERYIMGEFKDEDS